MVFTESGMHMQEPGIQPSEDILTKGARYIHLRISWMKSNNVVVFLFQFLVYISNYNGREKWMSISLLK